MKKERLIKNILVGILIFVTLWFGFRPVLKGSVFQKHLKMIRKDLDFEGHEYATIIIGSEPEGIASALSCARTGLKTLLITQDSDLGGYITSGKISKMNPQKGTIKGKRVSLNRGIYEEIFGQFNIGFSSMEYETQIKNLLGSEENLEVVYDSTITGVDIENEVLLGITVQNPEGTSYYKARNFIDATLEGSLLKLCKTPYIKGSADLGLREFYSPVEFNFCVSEVDTAALQKSQKTTNFLDDFQLALLSYKKIKPRTKIVSPTFIILNENEIVISGLQVYGVDVENKEDLEAAYKEAEEEAIMLTAYLKNVVVAFENCKYKEGPDRFFIPEYLHYEGRYRLTVEDIMENRNFKDGIALCSEQVDASKFTKENIEYIVVNPHVYSIPLGSIIPVNLENVLMTGSKASFSSLAATSAGNIPTRITVGESAGLISAYSFLNKTSILQLLNQPEEFESLKKYLKRGGVYLDDFSEHILIGETQEKLAEHPAYPYIKVLAEYGLITGGADNDFQLDSQVSQELLAVLLKNAIIKMAPDLYTLEIDGLLTKYENKDILTGKTAASMILDLLSIQWEDGNVLNILKEVLPIQLTEGFKAEEPVAMDIVYGLAVEAVKLLKP
ncbi:MAG: FAD-dependent oxidoreductase [Clostridiaceae bacterium]|nr:FAD-dependent oxidoreductase [Clostridiaceae bacterium]